jgi:hypothetical protein
MADDSFKEQKTIFLANFFQPVLLLFQKNAALQTIVTVQTSGISDILEQQLDPIKLQ